MTGVENGVFQHCVDRSTSMGRMSKQKGVLMLMQSLMNVYINSTSSLKTLWRSLYPMATRVNLQQYSTSFLFGVPPLPFSPSLHHCSLSGYPRCYSPIFSNPILSLVWLFGFDDYD